ncbi:hypothetical protein [Dickeya phage Sucellus]|nr:hypothetical protein [Dickeya phage Sucellus]
MIYHFEEKQMKLENYICVGIDTETIPSQDPEFMEKIKRKASGKVKSSGLKKPELIEALKEFYPTTGLSVAELEVLWMEKFGGDLVMQAFEDEHRRTSFSAFDGAEFVAMSAYVFGSGQEPASLYRWMEQGTAENNYVNSYGGPDESEMISRFFSYLSRINEMAMSQGKKMLLVGANHYGFDIKNLAHRALKLGAQLPSFPLISSRYSTDLYFDIIDIMAFHDNQGRRSLDSICDFLGVETPKGDSEGRIDGSMVWDIWREGGMAGAERIANYNKRDVLVLEPLFNKIHWLVK